MPVLWRLVAHVSKFSDLRRAYLSEQRRLQLTKQRRAQLSKQRRAQHVSTDNGEINVIEYPKMLNYKTTLSAALRPDSGLKVIESTADRTFSRR